MILTDLVPLTVTLIVLAGRLIAATDGWSAHAGLYRQR